MPAGYSGTPLAKKLGIKPGHRVVFVGAPDGFQATLGELPEDVQVKQIARAPLDVILFFTKRRSELSRRAPELKERLVPDGGLWICWPKQSSGVETDLGQFEVMETVHETGLVDNKVCAIDETWSGLRFVYRKADRP